MLEHIVELALVRVHLHLVPGRNTIRHIQVIQSLHGDGDVRDALVDQLLCALFRLVMEHHPAGRIHGCCLEIGFSVSADELTSQLAMANHKAKEKQPHSTLRDCSKICILFCQPGTLCFCSLMGFISSL